MNTPREYGRWSFAEFTDVFEIEQEFDKLIRQQLASSGPPPTTSRQPVAAPSRG